LPFVPISRDQFDRGKDPASWEQTIEGFLNSRPTQAFTAREVATAIQYPLGAITGAHGLHEILRRLAAQGRIQERLVRTGRQTDSFYSSMG
jgi:hypothetical protein